MNQNMLPPTLDACRVIVTDESNNVITDGVIEGYLHPKVWSKVPEQLVGSIYETFRVLRVQTVQHLENVFKVQVSAKNEGIQYIH